jgi:hypothetical protein
MTGSSLGPICWLRGPFVHRPSAWTVLASELLRFVRQLHVSRRCCFALERSSVTVWMWQLNCVLYSHSDAQLAVSVGFTTGVIWTCTCFSAGSSGEWLQDRHLLNTYLLTIHNRLSVSFRWTSAVTQRQNQSIYLSRYSLAAANCEERLTDLTSAEVLRAQCSPWSGFN